MRLENRQDRRLRSRISSLERVLAQETDYTVTYSSNENAGEADVTVEGKGNYTGAVTDKFTIEQAEVKPEIEVPAENGVMKLTIKDEPFYLYASYAGDGNITFASDDESVFIVEKTDNDRGNHQQVIRDCARCIKE